MAVPSPWSTAPAIHASKRGTSTVSQIPPAWTTIPQAIRPLRPTRSASGPGRGRGAGRPRGGPGREGAVPEGLPDQEEREAEPHEGDRDPEVERLRAERRVGGDVARDPRGHADREGPGELVEAAGGAAPPGAAEGDLPQ